MQRRAELIEICERISEEAVNGGDYSVLEDLLVDEEYESLDGSGNRFTLAQWRDSMERMHAAFPDMEDRIEAVYVDEDEGMAFVQNVMTGTFENDLVLKPGWGDEEMVFEPTGESFEMAALQMIQFEDGKIVGMGGYGDELEMFVDLGIFPELSELAA